MSKITDIDDPFAPFNPPPSDCPSPLSNTSLGSGEVSFVANHNCRRDHFQKKEQSATLNADAHTKNSRRSPYSGCIDQAVADCPHPKANFYCMYKSMAYRVFLVPYGGLSSFPEALASPTPARCPIVLLNNSASLGGRV